MSFQSHKENARKELKDQTGLENKKSNDNAMQLSRISTQLAKGIRDKM